MSKKIYLLSLIVFCACIFITVIPESQANTILRMHFNGDVNDYSSYNLNGEWVGTEFYSMGLDSNGQSLNLSPTNNNYVIVRHDEMLSGMQQLHISVWAKKNNPETGGDIIRKHNHYIMKIGANFIDGFITNNQGQCLHIKKYFLENIRNTSWHHYELKYDGEIISLLVDGLEVAQNNFTGSINTDASRDVYIGKNPWGSSFDGQIDELEIKNTVFNQLYRSLTLISENGIILKQPDKDIYSNGEQLELTAIPDEGFVFIGWEGDIFSSENPLAITMDDNNIVKAVFSQLNGNSVYYIDYQNGNDSNDGRSHLTPWKHAPGDPMATLNASLANLSPGDRVLFKGGVIYRGQIQTRWSGSEGIPIVYKGDGWGRTKAIIDGSEILTDWKKCESQADCGGNPNWQNIYYTYAPSSVNAFIANLTENGDMLQISQEPNQPDPFYMDNINYFYEIPCQNMTLSSIVDAERFPQTDSTHWNGSYVLVWRTRNIVDVREITGFIPSEHKIIFPELGLPPYADRNERYSIYNSIHAIDLPGEYFFDNRGELDGRHKIYLWPKNEENILQEKVYMSLRNYGIDIYGNSNIAIEGFEIRNFSGNGPRQGVGIGTINRSSLPISNITIKNNGIKHNRHGSFSGYGGIFLQRCDNAIIENNKLIENSLHRGIFCMSSSNIIFKNNEVRKPGSTGMSFYGVTDSHMINNLISDCKGTHANGISLYLSCNTITVSGNKIFEALSPLTFENSSNLLFYNNIIVGINGHAVNEWAGNTSGSIEFYHNIILRGEGNGAALTMGKNPTQALYVAKNNILDGMSISGIERSHNIYTALSYQQAPRYGWELAEGECIQTDLTALFIEPLSGDFRHKTGSTAIDAGINVNINTDISGNIRPNGNESDIGAYEY
ncbi:MAG: right-handed parallel beta-helix repeat-containing protein [Desulfobacterales bacterium]|nr:right-handed parallel beta-helix repeat-containing protein [Desulfobacterales bacterium]